MGLKVNTNKKGKRRHRRHKTKMSIKAKVNELWEDKKDDKRILDRYVTFRPTKPVLGNSGWSLFSFVDDIQQEQVIAAASAGGAAAIASSQVNGYRSDNKIRLENLSIDLMISLPELFTLGVQPNYASVRYRVVIFTTANWHYPVSASGIPLTLDPDQILPLITKYSNKGGTPDEMYTTTTADQYLYGKFSCQPQGLKYKILYDKRHMVSFNNTNFNPTVGISGNDVLAYSASKKNISIELKKKVQKHEVVYSLSQINGQQDQGTQEIDKGNLFMAIATDFNAGGAGAGSTPSVNMYYRIKYFT